MSERGKRWGVLPSYHSYLGELIEFGPTERLFTNTNAMRVPMMIDAVQQKVATGEAMVEFPAS